MTTFLKILGLVLLTAFILKFAPILMFPVALLLVGVGAAWLVFSVIVVLLLTVVFALLAGLSPIWLPILALIGLIALIRSGSRQPA